MSRLIRSLILFMALVSLPLPVSAQTLFLPHIPDPSGPNAPTAAAWYDGLIQYSTITNCISIIQGLPYQEYGMGTYVGFRADPDAGQPSPNTVYYVHVVVAGMGNACSGQRAVVDLSLPANTTLAIDATNKVYCYFDSTALAANECPQSFQSSSYNPGAYWIPSVDAAHAYTWPIPQGHFLEIQVPVKSSTALTNSTLQAHVWALDGNSSPWLHPQEGVYVFSSTPTIIYPSPSTITVTTTSAHSMAYLYTFGATGTGYFDLGTTTNYGLVHEPVAISSAGTAWLVWDDWGPPPLQPDTLYHWRFTFTSGAQTYYGTDQTFRTLPDGRVTVGNGASAGCTEAALDSALTTAKEIQFNCGVLPITITLSSAKSIAAPVTIDGDNKVILDAHGISNHFTLQAGQQLTLTQITLVNGRNTANCGGSIYVPGTARLILNEIRFNNNSSDFQGGAVCNWGSANISATLFTSNTAGTHGGAIGNYGTLSVNSSLFMQNRSSINGGGIDTTGSLTIADSIFVSNTVGFRGGGINNYLGTLTIAGSSFISNTAKLYGGGLANDGGPTTVSASTFRDNYADNYGGAVEDTGSLTLINSTVSGNRAKTNGGGLYWATAGGFTLLNDTFFNNSAGVQGGNIYASGTYTAALGLKNTIVAAGSPNNCDSPIVSQGHNLESANTCGWTAAGDQINTNPQLGSLRNNGGTTWTHALLVGSPAIDRGTNSGCPVADQRGVSRPIDGNRDGSAVCDIGAYEAPTYWPVFLSLVQR